MKLEYPEYVRLLIDEETKRIAVQPCTQDTPNAATFYNKEKKSNALSVQLHSLFKAQKRLKNKGKS